MIEENFKLWLSLVEKTIQTNYCYSPAELDDIPFREWFLEGMTHHDAARRAVRECYDSTHPPGVRDNP